MKDTPHTQPWRRQGPVATWFSVYPFSSQPPRPTPLPASLSSFVHCQCPTPPRHFIPHLNLLHQRPDLGVSVLFTLQPCPQVNTPGLPLLEQPATSCVHIHKSSTHPRLLAHSLFLRCCSLTLYCCATLSHLHLLLQLPDLLV